MIKTWEENKNEWEKFLPKLKKLNRDQLARLAKATGITFDDPDKVTKEEYLLVLDESGIEELKSEYEKIIKSKK